MSVERVCGSCALAMGLATACALKAPVLILYWLAIGLIFQPWKSR